jgi:hypothetical protein
MLKGELQALAWFLVNRTGAPAVPAVAVVRGPRGHRQLSGDGAMRGWTPHLGCGRRVSPRCWWSGKRWECRRGRRACWLSCGSRLMGSLCEMAGGRSSAASALLSRFLTSAATSSASPCTIGLLVVSLAIVGRKEASFDAQLDLEARFAPFLSMDLEDEYPWSASRYCLDGSFTTHCPVDGGLKCCRTSSRPRWLRSRLNMVGFRPILRRW